ncbi:hypothetical protein [Maritimibacter sp. DP1N21-5]|uniref:hypothetical protein n=1 Tax=Maritimibacter sp. DP1N21-5 TaxID=2836867 RepID=UPI001C45B385|nr:hypothetical protein [Maritimibacter sp. DP1N21-5]MBV7408214.1 hypothetical protein [Maritimibacter sp. DP1N21-5]
MIDKMPQVLADLPDHVKALIVSGAAGAFVRAIYAPEHHWRRRVIEGIAGGASAVFLGGVVGHVIAAATGAGVSSYLAAGFVMGEGGLAAIRAFRQHILKEKAK